MEELIQKIDELIKEIHANSVPLWITIIGILVPIFISLLVLWQGCQQNKRNHELQKQVEENQAKLQREISSKELKVQMHSDFLKIYDDYSFAQSIIGQARDNVSVVFFNNNITWQWINDLEKANGAVCQAMNRARLLLPDTDKEFVDVLINIFQKYAELNAKVFNYINTGVAEARRQETWIKISKTYNIPNENYMALIYNPTAYNDFIKLYSNKETEAINEMINELLPLFAYDNFDKYFEKYLRIDS